MKKKTVALILALVMVFGAAVGGTIAYLTSTKSVTNTFTVGKVAITLDEAKVDEYGVVDATATERVDTNTYKLIPGHTYTKDPIVHFAAKSEASWLFVKVEDDLVDIEADTKIAAQIADNGWTALEGVSGVYYKSVPANTGDAAVNYPVFANFKLTNDANVAAYENAKIVVTAYAIQKDGFATAALAWDEASK